MAASREVREQRLRWGTFEWPDLSAMLAERLAAEDFSDATVLDVGTGEGRLALRLAPRAARIVAVDLDERALSRGRMRAMELGLGNVTFLVADADRADYRQLAGGPPDYVVANYFLSKAAVRQASAALPVGGKLLFGCHHRDNWIESGRVGRFSFDEARLESLLTANGFTIEFLGVERLLVTYASLEELGAAHPSLHAKFLDDGRWEALRTRFAGERPRLTWATAVGVAVRRERAP